MSDAEKPICEELTEAINKVRRGLEILQAPSSIGGAPDNASVVADLEQELQRLLVSSSGIIATETSRNSLIFQQTAIS